nr:cobalt transporter subunit CbtA (proposed) [Methylibium sp. T29-B]
MLFQRLIWCALVAALFVGSVQFAVQRWQAVPLILAAEVFEDQKAAPVAAVAHEHAAAARMNTITMTLPGSPLLAPSAAPGRGWRMCCTPSAWRCWYSW